MSNNRPVPSLDDWYQSALDRGFVAEPAQQHAVAVLKHSLQELHTGADTRHSVYLWGPVGRGKTWLMDGFYAQLQVPARRQHFHRFMQWLHRRLNQLSGTPEPLLVIARELADEIRVLCFDEVFVNDIADATLLGGLFQQLFAQGLCLVMTSNQPPHELYKDGFNRERFLPTIAALEHNMQLVAVDGGQDHRLHEGEAVQRYWVQQSGQVSVLPQVFMRLSGGVPPQAGGQTLAGRHLEVLGCTETLLYCDFMQLCGQPWSALDFIELCDRFSAVLLAGVPVLYSAQHVPAIARGTEDGVRQVKAGERQLPRLTRMDDAVRRFIALIDECYDRRVPVYIEAEVPLQQLQVEGHLAFAFRRTHSRLSQMQLQAFVEQ